MAQAVLNRGIIWWNSRTRRNVEYEEFELPKQKEFGGTGSPELPSPERPPPRKIDQYIRPEFPCLSKRYTMAVLTCMGFIISFGMRCNMGMAKLKLEKADSLIHWTVNEKSAIDSSFFVGYLITHIPGGFLASKYSATYMFGTAIFCSSFLNLFVPTAASIDSILLISIRITQGLIEGVTYPASHGIWRFWAPPLERSRLATLAMSGSYAGVVIGMPLSASLAEFSWKAPFYFYGFFGAVWYVMWLWLTFEKPALHPTISAKELVYIEQSIGTAHATSIPTFSTTPWKCFFTSMPVNAIIVANFCRSWNFYLLVLFQTAYMEKSFDLTIATAGFIAALPHLIMTIIVPFGGLLADHLRKNGIMTTTQVRKVFNCGGFGMEALFFVVVAFSNTAVLSTLALTIGVAFSGFAISGYNVNHLDIAPRYASILMGMSNGVGTIAGFLCPIFVDHITDDGDRRNWRTVFLMAASVHAFGITFYGIFASGELQPWAEPPKDELSPGPQPQRPPPPVMDTGGRPYNPFDQAFQGQSTVSDQGYTDQTAQLQGKPPPSYGAVEPGGFQDRMAYPNQAIDNNTSINYDGGDSYDPYQQGVNHAPPPYNPIYPQIPQGGNAPSTGFQQDYSQQQQNPFRTSSNEYNQFSY